MATEIERKFLLKNDNWRSLVTKQAVMRQGYLGLGSLGHGGVGQGGGGQNLSNQSQDEVSIGNEKKTPSPRDVASDHPPKASVRVRISGDKALLNIKSATLGIHRKEYEFPIGLPDATEILGELCDLPLIEKTRFYVPFAQHLWEIDVFEGDNAGLVVAEIELSHTDEEFERPDWLGEEVSADPRYYNVCLVKHPFKDW